MDIAKRTVLIALFGSRFLIPEDYEDNDIGWKRFQTNVQLALENRPEQSESSYHGRWTEPLPPDKVVTIF